MNLSEKQKELERKNMELEQRKKQIEEELKKLEEGPQDDNDDLNRSIPQEDKEFEEGEEGQAETTKEQDIIGQIEAVRKVNQERNQNKIKELKKIFESNKTKILKNQQKLEKLEHNIEQADTAVKIKNEFKKELQSKGKKISEQSKKWISDVSKLNDKCQEMKNNLGILCKEEESLKNQYSASEKRLQQIQKQKASYQAEQKTLQSRTQQLIQQLQSAKNLIKQKDVISKEQNQKEQKLKQKSQLNQKRLQRQKNQLIKAYKKLSQYISLLRKTNTHLQTANSLGFGMKEYLQAIDKTDILA